MTRTIWKFILSIIDEQIVEVPSGAVPLSVGQQGGDLYLWAEVDPSRPRVDRKVYVQGTGNPLQVDGAQFVGTVQMPPFVWHIYMEPAHA